MALDVVWLKRSDFTRSAVLWLVVNLRSVLPSFDVHFFTGAINAHKNTRHADPRRRFLRYLRRCPQFALRTTVDYMRRCSESGMIGGPSVDRGVLGAAELEAIVSARSVGPGAKAPVSEVCAPSQ